MGSLVEGRLNLTRPVYLYGLQFQILYTIIANLKFHASFHTI